MIAFYCETKRGSNNVRTHLLNHFLSNKRVCESIMEIKRNTANMEKTMNEYLRKKKTRRGKRIHRRSNGNSNRVGSEGNENVLTTSLNPDSLRFHSKPRGRKINQKHLRPTSPKAPQNSTTFLMEDRGNDIDFIYGNSPISSLMIGPMENSSTSSITTISPEHMLEEAHLMDNDSCSMYADEVVDLKIGMDDQVYTPISFDDTVDFISKDYEREVARQQYEDDLKKKTSLINKPKIELVREYMKMENVLNKIALKEARKSRKGFKGSVLKLQKENEELKMENQLLKSLSS